MRSLLAIAVLAATGPVASAGTYIGLGIGTAPSVGNDTITGAQNDGRSGRLLLGQSFGLPIGRLAIEGEANRFSMILNGEGYDSTMLGVDLKYSLPLGNGFEAFGRLGLERSWLSANGDASDYEGSGDGYYVGLGFEYRIAIFGSLFVDYERQSSTIDSPTSTTYGQTAGMFTLGATINL
jgi:hypothetical protein